MQIFLQYVICCFFLSVTNSLFKFLLLLNGYLLESEDVYWNRLEHTKRRVKVLFLSRNAFIFPYVYHRSLFLFIHTLVLGSETSVDLSPQNNHLLDHRQFKFV